MVLFQPVAVGVLRHGLAPSDVAGFHRALIDLQIIQHVEILVVGLLHRTHKDVVRRNEIAAFRSGI